MTTLSNFLRGGEDLNARRKSVLNLAFSSMDKKGTGAIEPEVLLAVYKPSRHPDVISGKRSEESALQEFLTTFDVGVEVEGKVTQNEFENHYKRMSYSIPEDEVFETMIRELYGVSGRHGDDRHSAMNKLLSQKDADARLLSMHLKEYREQLLQAEQMSDNSKAVLSKLGSNNTSEISANVQQMNHNLINDDVSWPTDASSIATAIAGPDAASGSAPYPPRSAFPVPEVAVPAGVAHIIGKLKSRLRSSGVQGFVSLQRAIRSMDKHDKKRINMTDFKIAMKKVETGLSDSEVRMLFDYFNNEHRGSIDTENFVRKVRSALNDRRLILVKQAFAKLDLTGDGAVDVATVAGCYDSTSTPDVIAGRMTPENALLEFLGTFDVGGDIEGMVTIAEFINYYTNIGACVDNDEYFDLLVRNSWHVGGDRQEPSKKVFVTRKDGSQYIEDVVDCSQDESKSDSKSKRALQGISGVHRQTFNIFKQTNEFSEVSKSKKVSKSRPLIEVSQSRVPISNDHPALNSVLVRPSSGPGPGDAVRGPIGHDEAIAIMGPSVHPQPHRECLPSSPQQTPNYGIKHMILKLKTDIRSLGMMGFIGLQRRFRAIDRDNTKSLSLSDFKKAMRQMNMTLIDGELRILFEFYDSDSCGLIDYEYFIRSIRDPLTGLRLSLVNLAFDQLDRQGTGLLDAAEMASLYDATRHPDVIRGSTSSQQALSSFLETFDVGSVRQGKVTRQEFINYYSNISESVENDDYFELMIRNVWHVDGHSDAQSQAASKRVMMTRPDGSQHVEEYKDTRGRSSNQLIDKAELEQRAVVVAKLQGRAPPGALDAGSLMSPDSIHKIMQTNKRRTYQHRSTVGLLVDATAKHKHSGDRGHVQPTAGEQVLLDKLKGEVAVGGARGLVGLQRALRAADSDRDKMLTLPELKQALQEVHHTLSGAELRLLFSYFDPFATGFISCEQVVEAVRNELSAWRLALVKKTFLQLDDYKEGFIEASRCALRYNASNHPEVIAGRMSAEKAQKEFLEIFDVLEGFVTEDSFIDYYTVIGTSIDSDQYFELLIRSTWTRKDLSIEEKEGAESGNGVSTSASRNRFRARDPSSIPIAAGVKLNLKGGQGRTAELGWLGHDNSTRFEGHTERYKHTRREPNQGESLIINNLRKELVQRSHANGYIALERSFRRTCGRTKTLPLSDFIRVIKDLGLCMTDTESRVLFDYFDVKGMGLLDYREFIAGIRPRLSKSRLDLVVTAFKCLDRAGEGVIDASLVISAYDPSGHPDVFLGVKTPEEVMEEWLSTFDVGGTVVGRVTEQEFITYYANIGASIGNEEYFELMLIHAWKPQRHRQGQGQGQVQEREQGQGQGQGQGQKQFDDDVEPELTSEPVHVSFDLSHHELPMQGQGRASEDRAQSSMSASMQNWMEANSVFDHPGSDTEYQRFDSSGCEKGPRHFSQRKSQIHFN